MSLRTQIWMVACLLAMAGISLTGARVHAGDKKPAVGGVTSIFKGAPTKLDAAQGKARVEGELNAEAPVVQNHYYRVYTFKMEEGKSYRIDHMSDDFDAFLFLEDPAGKKLAQDDDSGGGLNSRIIFKAPATGAYRIISTSLKTKETGKFVLQVAPASAEEEKEAALLDRVSRIADASPAEQKKITAEVTKRFQDKGEKLNVNDFQLAFQVTNALEDGDINLAKKTYADYIKLFSASENPQIAKGAASEFERSLKKLDMIGKEIAITGKTVDGKDYDLKNMKGKVVLVDFWATWCGPCIQELPNMEAAYKKYHGKGFDIIGISLDRPGDDEKLSKFIETRKMGWPCINIEDSRTLADKYHVNSIPFPVLVDANGRVVSLRARGPQLERLLERMLGEKK
jgi:thiol-disulfide isomerase/thioredoxin